MFYYIYRLLVAINNLNVLLLCLRVLYILLYGLYYLVKDTVLKALLQLFMISNLFLETLYYLRNIIF